MFSLIIEKDESIQKYTREQIQKSEIPTLTAWKKCVDRWTQSLFTPLCSSKQHLERRFRTKAELSRFIALHRGNFESMLLQA